MRTLFWTLLLITPSVFADPDFSKLPKSEVDFKQLVWVKPSAKPLSTASLWEKEKNKWVRVGGDFKVSLGRTGSALPGEKREGDGHTPHGLYPLTEVFGRGASQGYSLPYTEIQQIDKWVDDPESDQYNQWIRGDTKAKSFENLWRKDSLYDRFIVIGYNMSPVVKGMGSAIFFHIWEGEGKGTAGCVATDRPQLEKILKWLQKPQSPHLYVGELATAR